jgi:hypothetical protein
LANETLTETQQMATVTITPPPRSLTRLDAPTCEKLDFFDSLCTTWFDLKPTTGKPIAISPYEWVEVARHLYALDQIWGLDQQKRTFPMKITIKPYTFTEPIDFHIDPETWAQVAVFLEKTFDYYTTEQLAGSSEFVADTLMSLDLKADTVQLMIDETDKLFPDFWSVHFRFEIGAIFYEDIKKDSLLPLAQRMWKHFHTPGDCHSFIGKHGYRYAAPTLPIPIPGLKEIAPAIHAFYTQCGVEASKAITKS